MKKRYTLIGGIIILALIVVFLFRTSGIFNPLTDLVTVILKPIQGNTFIFSSTIHKYLEKRQSYEDLRKENESLRAERDKLIQDKSLLDSEIRELTITRQEEEFLKNKGYHGVVSRIIGRTSDSMTEEILINIGKNNGINEGYAVISQNGYLIGKVIESRDSISKVRLIIDRQSEVAATVQNDTSAPGIVIGQHGLSLEMQLIPQNEVITRDQVVITSGLESNIPQGIVIGTISSTAINPGDIFQSAVVTSPIRFDHLQITSVIIPQTIIND
ncbi:MAG: rod shape-determining protein MreC [Patescibacteria group bacterium]